jgi:hypothetical protein
MPPNTMRTENKESSNYKSEIAKKLLKEKESKLSEMAKSKNAISPTF